MFSLDEIRGLLAEAERRSRWAGESAWLDWVAERGDLLVEAMGAWLDRLRAEPPADAAQTTRQVLALWAAPGVVKRPDIVQVAACFAATCPARLGDGFAAADEVPRALGRLLGGRTGLPDLPIQILLWHASLRPDLARAPKAAFARFAFPHNASALRSRLLDSGPDDDRLAHQAWLLRFAEHPEFAATWGALFQSASAPQRLALLDAVVGQAAQEAVLEALAQIVIGGPLEPADSVARFAARLNMPASGVFLAWCAAHGPLSGVAAAVEGLRPWHGDGVREALAAAAQRAEGPLVDTARALHEATAGGPDPDDALSRRIAAALEG